MIHDHDLRQEAARYQLRKRTPEERAEYLQDQLLRSAAYQRQLRKDLEAAQRQCQQLREQMRRFAVTTAAGLLNLKFNAPWVFESIQQYLDMEGQADGESS